MKSGFTLIEVMIAISLLVIALSLFVGTFVQAKRSAVISNNRIESIHNARTAMETLLSCTYGSAQLSDGGHTSSVAGVLYSVVTVTQGAIIVKDIYLTNYWTNATMTMTSTVSLMGSMSSELHQ